MFESYKGRKVDRTRRVWVYRNLNRRDRPWYSVMQGGRVVAHATKLSLKDVRFTVREGGRRRALSEGRKNVHAFAVGRLISADYFPHADDSLRGMYSPSTGFVAERQDGRLLPVTAAVAVTFNERGMLVHEPV